jgi:hypothetical protein
MAQFSRFLRSLTAIDPHGPTSLTQSVSDFLSRTRESGVVILISDFFGAEDLRDPLARLGYRGDDVLAVQILDREDADPSLTGPVQFQDVETDERTAIAVGPATLEAYRKRFEAFEAGLRRELESRRIPLFVTTTDRPLERFIHEDLRAGGVLQ